MRHLSEILITVEAVRESYSLNNIKFVCINASILNKRIIKDRVILSCGYLDTG